MYRRAVRRLCAGSCESGCVSTHNSDMEEGRGEFFGWLGLVEKTSLLLSMLNLKCILVK